VLLHGLLHLLYPAACHVCHAVVPAGSGPFCSDCLSALIGDRASTCPRCASTIGPYTDVASGCPHCRSEPFAFDKAVRLGPYEGVLRDVVLRLKHLQGEGLAEMIGTLWAEKRLNQLQALGAEVVVPVPLHWWRRWQRGYNQSEALARGLAHRLGLPCRPRWLRRIRNTPLQTQQSAAARRENVHKAFQCRARTVTNHAVLLVDDVMATGSTVNEAAVALRRAGAPRVVVAVLGRSHASIQPGQPVDSW